MVHFIVESTSPDKHQQQQHQPTLQNHRQEQVSLSDRMEHAARGIQKLWRHRGHHTAATVEDTRADILLPILIIPGVASSGLRIEQSGIDNAKYAGSRVWMNAAMLAAGRILQQRDVLNAEEIKQAVLHPSRQTVQRLISDSQTKGKQTILGGTKLVKDAVLANTTASDNDSDSNDRREEEDAFAEVEQACQVRSAWLHHMSLSPNMIDEREGNCVRPYQGLEGIEYLSDDSATKLGSWVHAPVTKYLVTELGYTKGKNLDGAPYDWRLPPKATEDRDGYLTKTIARIEKMYHDNDGLPVILVCHSMGCKMGHYFLNFALRERGQAWLDQYIHTYMPVGAPHGGVSLAVRAGVTGKGLSDEVDMMMAGDDEGLTLYRSWGSGAWLMPRYLPTDVVPSAIVRREGELAITIRESQLQVGPLFANRDKLPKDLRLAVEFRGLVARTEFHPLIVKKDTITGKKVEPLDATVAFDETFYIAVPYLGDYDTLGEVQFFLEEPAGRLNQNHSEFRARIKQSTSWAPIRTFKKKASKAMRNVAKMLGASMRVAMSSEPCRLQVSQFPTETDDANEIELEIPMCGCRGSKIIEENDNDMAEEDANETPEHSQKLGNLHFLLRYRPHPMHTCGEKVDTPIAAVTPGKTPVVPIESSDNRGAGDVFPATFETWTGYDLLKNDGFCSPIWPMLQKYYEDDPLGPTKASALDAPPVKRVRSIYGINLETEVSAVYRHRPVVVVGDDKADSRYVVDETARFPDEQDGIVQSNPWARHNLYDYKMNKGRISETPQTLQKVPGKAQQRRVCGDGTVPYWNLIHCLSWKDSVEELTIDELEKAEHRGILADKRFHALLKQYCKIKDPRANAMLHLREQNQKARLRMTKGAGGIGTLQSALADLEPPSAGEGIELDIDGKAS